MVMVHLSMSWSWLMPDSSLVLPTKSMPTTGEIDTVKIEACRNNVYKSPVILGQTVGEES